MIDDIFEKGSKFFEAFFDKKYWVFLVIGLIILVYIIFIGK